VDIQDIIIKSENKLNQDAHYVLENIDLK